MLVRHERGEIREHVAELALEMTYGPAHPTLQFDLEKATAFLDSPVHLAGKDVSGRELAQTFLSDGPAPTAISVTTLSQQLGCEGSDFFVLRVWLKQAVEASVLISSEGGAYELHPDPRCRELVAAKQIELNASIARKLLDSAGISAAPQLSFRDLLGFFEAGTSVSRVLEEHMPQRSWDTTDQLETAVTALLQSEMLREEFVTIRDLPQRLISMTARGKAYFAWALGTASTSTGL